MGEYENFVLQWATTCKDSDEFVNRIERISVPSNEKGRMFFQIGTILCNHSYFELAINSWEKALDYCIADANKGGESACYGNLGVAYRNMGDFKQAIEYQKSALQLAKEIGDRVGESNCYGNLGNTYHSLGDFRRAIEYCEKALQLAKEIGYRVGESADYTNLGKAYRSLGDFKQAIEYHKRALQLAKEIGDRVGESNCYGNLGNTYRNLGDFKQTIEYCEKALQLAKEIGYRAGESACYVNLGTAYHSLGDSKRAIEYYEKAVQLAKEIGYRAGESICYLNLGSAYYDLGDFSRAIEYYGNALGIAELLGKVDYERDITFNLGYLYYESNPELAYKYCRRSIELSEIIGAKLVEEQYIIGFHGQTSNVYQTMVPLCLKLKRETEAFENTERSKSRAFLEVLASTKIKPTVELTSQMRLLLDEEEKQLSDLRNIQTHHLKQNSTQVPFGDVDRILERLDVIYDKIGEFDPEYVSARRAKPLSLGKVQDMLSFQKRDSVIIEYFATDKEIFIFVISSKNRELHVKSVPLSAEKLVRYADDYWKEVVNYRSYGEIGSAWLDLSNYLIKPVSEFLSNQDLIYFVPYGLLHYLPLHALELAGNPLIKTHPVAYSPSSSLLKSCLGKGTGKLETCASFGVDFEAEASAVAGIFKRGQFGNNSYNGQEATKEKVCASLDKDVLHFSCHGYFNGANPLSSGVQLYDGVLTAREIFEMRLNTELVTLSACQTGFNERSQGDELIGLTRAFLYAGTPSILASLWSVDANSTQELMVEFYTNLKKGADKATALQKAQNKIMEMEKYSHPYYWAPFILVGKW
jgi:CHAT domain-containing protein/tetratricopeptide (TPR) repeat protein